jgi:hypothetical protein
MKIEIITLDKKSYLAILSNLSLLLDTETSNRQLNLIQDCIDMMEHIVEEANE